MKIGPRTEAPSHHACPAEGRLIPTPTNTRAIQGTSHRDARTSHKQKGSSVTVMATFNSFMCLEWVLGGHWCRAKGFILLVGQCGRVLDLEDHHQER